MKNFIDENVNRVSAFNDFLDNLDNDFASPANTLESESVNNIGLDEDNKDCTALTVAKPNSLFVAQTMFRKSIKLSIKSFLISLSLGFLNLFI